MGSPDNKGAPCKIGDRSTSDVVVRLRTQEGRDDWIYCHSHILTKNSKYFADRLSEDWPTCQILDSRNCVEVFYREPDLDYNIGILRLFYVTVDNLTTDVFHGVRNALGILRVAKELDCPGIVALCVDYLEAVPWEETEEEEILRVIPSMGSSAEPVLRRLQPVDTPSIVRMFLSAIRFATSPSSLFLTALKRTAQEQLEYMLTEDDDAPLVTADNEIKLVVRDCFRDMLTSFTNLVEALVHEPKESNDEKVRTFAWYLPDLIWACQISAKLDMMRDIVVSWTEASESIVKVVGLSAEAADVLILQNKARVIEITTKILEAIGYGTVILPTVKRLHMVKVWLPFVRETKATFDFERTSEDDEDDDPLIPRMESEWQSLESAFVSIIVKLPSVDQAEILTQWLEDEKIGYPDLTEAFEVWCYRSKVAKRRFASLGKPTV